MLKIMKPKCDKMVMKHEKWTWSYMVSFRRSPNHLSRKNAQCSVKHARVEWISLIYYFWLASLFSAWPLCIPQIVVSALSQNAFHGEFCLFPSYAVLHNVTDIGERHGFEISNILDLYSLTFLQCFTANSIKGAIYTYIYTNLIKSKYIVACQAHPALGFLTM